jgi:hypothetical protein
MATAAAKRQAKNQGEELVAKFQEAYATHLEEARMSAETTATAAWQALYANHREGVKKAYRELAKELRIKAETMEGGTWTAEDEKELGELKKQLTDLRERNALFEIQTIAPVKKPVDECDKAIRDAVNEAVREEEYAPLVLKGLATDVRRAVAEVERPKWDEGKGVVVIEPARFD